MQPMAISTSLKSLQHEMRKDSETNPPEDRARPVRGTEQARFGSNDPKVVRCGSDLALYNHSDRVG